MQQQKTEANHNADALVGSIKAQFPADFLIEVYVLMTGGNPLLVFSGPQPKLCAADFIKVISNPGVLYLLSVAGIPPNLVDIPDMVKEKGKRMQFCWITPPRPPVLVKRGSRELGLEWNPLSACGVHIGTDDQEGTLQYALEGAQGEQFHRGVAPTKLLPSPGTDFKLICRGNNILSTTVENLDASYWYYWRVVYEYAGARFESPPVAINTVGGVPLVPKTPIIETVKFPGPMLEKRTSVEYKVKISWPPAEYVGASIEKYMLQLHEVSVSLSEMEKESMAPGVDSPKSKMFRQYHKIAIDENIDRSIQTKDIKSSRWMTVYCDIGNTFSTKAPPLGTLQWNFRLRAKNCYGWSEDWVYFYINAKSHPFLFPAGKNFDPRRYMRIAPAGKETAPALQTQPSIGSQTPTTAGSKSILDGGRSLAETVNDEAYKLLLTKKDEIQSHAKKNQPPTEPPRELRSSQLAQQSTDTSSVWMDDGRSLDIQSMSADGSHRDEDKLQKLAESEVTRYYYICDVEIFINNCFS